MSGEFKGKSGQSHEVSLELRARLYVSRRRAWPGEKVSVSLDTDNVPDDTRVLIKLIAKGKKSPFHMQEPAGPMGLTDEELMGEEANVVWEEECPLSKGSTGCDWTIGETWDNPPLGEYEVVAAIDDPSWESNRVTLFLDVSPPLFSA